MAKRDIPNLPAPEAFRDPEERLQYDARVYDALRRHEADIASILSFLGISSAGGAGLLDPQEVVFGGPTGNFAQDDNFLYSTTAPKRLTVPRLLLDGSTDGASGSAPVTFTTGRTLVREAGAFGFHRGVTSGTASTAYTLYAVGADIEVPHFTTETNTYDNARQTEIVYANLAQTFRVAYSLVRLGSSTTIRPVAVGSYPYGNLVQDVAFAYQTNPTGYGPRVTVPALTLNASDQTSGSAPLNMATGLYGWVPAATNGNIYHVTTGHTQGGTSSIWYVDSGGTARELVFVGSSAFTPQEWTDGGSFMYPTDGTTERVHIGVTTVQAYKLEVRGDAAAESLTALAHLRDATDNTIEVLRLSKAINGYNGPAITFYDLGGGLGNSLRGYIQGGYGVYALRLGTEGDSVGPTTWSWAIISNHFGLGGERALVPGATNSYDIGTPARAGSPSVSSAYVRSIYVNNVYASATLALGIAGTTYWTINTARLSPNVDDTYEIGTNASGATRYVNKVYSNILYGNTTLTLGLAGSGGGAGTPYWIVTSTALIGNIDSAYDIGNTGNYRPRDLFVARDIAECRHIVANQGSAPTVSASSGWGNTATVAVATGSTDTQGRITVTVPLGATGIAANPTVTLTFGNSYTTPRGLPVLQQYETKVDTALPPTWVTAYSATAFTFKVEGMPTDNNTWSYIYHVIAGATA